MRWTLKILLVALCRAVQCVSTPPSKIQSLAPANGTAITPDLTEPGKPRASGSVDYWDEQHPGNFCRFTPRHIGQTSQILSLYKMSPAVTDAMTFAFDLAAASRRGREEPMPGGARGRHFLNFGVIIRMRPADDARDLEIYALHFCMQKLLYWAHVYSFANSDFEYWASQPGGTSHRKGVGDIFVSGQS